MTVLLYVYSFLFLAGWLAATFLFISIMLISSWYYLHVIITAVQQCSPWAAVDQKLSLTGVSSTGATTEHTEEYSNKI